MHTAVIIDDEKRVRDILKNITITFQLPIDIIGEASNKSEGIEIITTLDPDIVLMDVMLGEIKSFEILKELRNFNGKVIFISGYNEFAVEAFRFSAIDYLLKPIDPEELKEAVQRATEQLKNDQASLKLEVLLSNLVANGASDKKIVLQTLEKTFIVQVQDILRCESSNNYTQFFLKSGEKLLISKPIKLYDDLLTPYHFYRVHKSHLVNINFVKGIIKKDGGYLELTNNDQVPISSRKKDKITAIIGSIGIN